MPTTIRFFCQYVVIYAFTGFLLFQQAYTQIAIPDTLALFDKDEPLKISLLFDFRYLTKNKFKEEYQPAIITYEIAEGKTIEKNILVTSRGESRKRLCYLPPLKLNFKETSFEYKAMFPLTSVKVVTNCKNASIFEQYVYKEYLAYKLFSFLTPFSYRARLAEITYMDSKEKVKTFTKHGIILEQTKHLAQRMKCIELEEVKISQFNAQRAHMILVAMFQYMIGNTDWSVPDFHNIKVMKEINYSQQIIYVVPYDFDYSGFVNASYAVPHESLGIESVRDRLYQGTCVTEGEWEKTIQTFLDKKSSMYGLIASFPLLTNTSRRECREYLDSFYNCIENRHIWKGTFNSTCK